MKRAMVVVVWVLCLSLGTRLGVASAQELPLSARLVEDPLLYDGTEVEFTGEAVGELMERDGGAWIHLNDDAYMERNVEEGAVLGGYNTGQAVWVPGELAHVVTRFGDYHNEGDIVRIRGVFHAACPEHGGDMDIHAEAVELVRSGHSVVDPVAPWKPMVALLLALLATGAFGLHTWHRMRV